MSINYLYYCQYLLSSQAKIQKNHLACALLVWTFLTKVAQTVSQTWCDIYGVIA